MKKEMIKSDGNNYKSMLLIFLCWLVYSTSYLGKVNYAANITQIIDFYGVTKAQAGAVPTFFFFAYGIGQVVNGLFCKKYNIKWVIFISLFVSAIINLIIAVTTNFAIIKWLWMVNGFVLSMLWPTLIRLLSECLPQRSLSLSSVAMGTTVATGTLVIYALSSLYAAFGSFKLSFYTASFAVLIVSVIWLILYKKSSSDAKCEKYDEESLQTKNAELSDVNINDKSDNRLFFATVAVLCFCAVGVNLTKDGLTTWVPSILKEEFAMSDSISILLTLFLPVLAVFGNVFALSMHNKVPDYINHCTLVFAIIAVFIAVVIGSLFTKIILLMLAGLVVVNFLASSLNSLITGIFPLFMRGRVNSGLIAGVLNGFCYLGSTISSYGLGTIADNLGWVYVFYTLLGFCFLSFVAWGIYMFCKNKFKA